MSIINNWFYGSTHYFMNYMLCILILVLFIIGNYSFIQIITPMLLVMIFLLGSKHYAMKNQNDYGLDFLKDDYREFLRQRARTEQTLYTRRRPNENMFLEMMMQAREENEIEKERQQQNRSWKVE